MMGLGYVTGRRAVGDGISAQDAILILTVGGRIVCCQVERSPGADSKDSPIIMLE